MNPARSWPWLETAVLAFCGWTAADLLTAWRTSPLDRWGWLAFVIWLAPLVIAAARRRLAAHSANPVLLGAALATALVARLGDLSVAGHLALALGWAAWLPPSRHAGIWLASAAAWTPAFGWLLRDLVPTALPLTRVVVAALGATTLLNWHRRPAPGDP